MAAASGKRRAQVCQRPRQRQRKLPGAPVGVLLAFGVGVGKQAADRKQQNGAQPQSQPCRHQQPRGLAHHDGRHEKNKRASPRGQPSAAADGEQHQDQQREEDVEAHLHAHPSAQRN